MDKLAALGGNPVRSTPFQPWPQFDEAERSAVLRVLDSRNWWATEGCEVRAFEAEWAAFTGARGTAALAGTNVIYTPRNYWYGVDTFTYTVTDDFGAHSNAVVTVAVTGRNDTPVSAPATSWI